MNHGRTWVTDAGYESEENYHYLDDENMVPYIKPSNYEYAKTPAYAKAMVFCMAMEYRPVGGIDTQVRFQKPGQAL